VFSASGGWGGHGCGYSNDETTVTADFMASDPNVTGVGGTTLVNTTATPEAYTSESCWTSPPW
jgi:subtilase family serine protease